MTERVERIPDIASVRSAMELAWRDHHHARDQTWKAVQMVAALGAGFITVEIQFHNFVASLATGILVVLTAYFAITIAKNHRKLERRKFIHIMNCEEWLGLHRDDLIPLSKGDNEFLLSKEAITKDGSISVPKVYSLWEALNPTKHNTSLFMIRMLLAIITLVIIFISFRWFVEPR